MAARRMAAPSETMSLFNTQVSDAFIAKLQPMFDAMAKAGEAFKAKKDVFLGQFENRGVTGSDFKKIYYVLLELRAKKRTLKSVSEQFPSLQRVDVQELSKILSQQEPEILPLLYDFQRKQHEVLQEAKKNYDIYCRHIPDGDSELDAAYEDIIERTHAMDDEVRAGLKI